LIKIESSEYNVPSQTLSSCTLRFLFAISSSFFLASNPSFARFIFIALYIQQVEHQCSFIAYCITYFLRRTSSSIKSSLDCNRSRTLKGGSRFFRRGSVTGVEIGSSRALRMRWQACLIMASSSSRLSLSESSDSAWGVGEAWNCGAGVAR